MRSSLGFMVNNHPTLRVGPKDKGGAQGLTCIMLYSITAPQDTHKRLVLQVSASELSAIRWLLR